jgi:hypothetical protein
MFHTYEASLSVAAFGRSNVILPGLRTMSRLGVWLAVRLAKLAVGDNPVALVVSLNLRRRHLSESQRGMVHARIATLPKGVRSDSSIGLSVPTQERAAEMLNVSVATGKRARVVLDDGA